DAGDGAGLAGSRGDRRGDRRQPDARVSTRADVQGAALAGSRLPTASPPGSARRGRRASVLPLRAGSVMPTVGGQSNRGPGDRAADGHYHRHDPVETGAERQVFGMRFGVLGTGIVGRSIAGGLAALDHDVVIGTRDTAAVMARTDRDATGNEP